MSNPLLRDFAEQLKATADSSIQAARTDVVAFAEYVMRDPKTGAPIELQPFHQEMLKAVMEDRFVLIQCFRGGGKSTLMSVMLPLFWIMQNRDVRIMLITASDVLSKSWLREIERYMSSEPYQRLVGGDITHGPLWTNEEKTVKGRSPSASGSTIRAVGVGGQVRGWRNDKVIGDDLISESNSHTQYQRDVLSHFFHSAVLPTLDHVSTDPLSGQCVVVGTPLYDSDLYSVLNSEWK